MDSPVFWIVFVYALACIGYAIYDPSSSEYRPSARQPKPLVESRASDAALSCSLIKEHLHEIDVIYRHKKLSFSEKSRQAAFKLLNVLLFPGYVFRMVVKFASAAGPETEALRAFDHSVRKRYNALIRLAEHKQCGFSENLFR